MRHTIDKVSEDRYRLKVGTGDIELDVGGSRINFWGGESSIDLLLPQGRTVPQHNKDKVVYSRPDMDMEFYGEGVNFEYDIVLKAPPQDSKLVLPCDLANIQAHYQGELDAQAKAEGHIRPPEVEGGYALYHGTRMAFRRNGVGGQAGLLYRPKARRADGRELWIPITLEEGKLTLSLDPSFFSGPYPITIDPTFGLDTQGGTTDTSGENRMRGAWDVTDGSGGVASVMSVWCRATTANKDVKGGLYQYIADDDAGLRRDYTNASTVTANGAAQKEIAVEVGYTLAATTKYFLIGWGQADGGSFYFYYNSVANKGVIRTITFDDWPADMEGDMTGIGRQYSVSCDYAPAGAPVTVTPPTIALADTQYAPIFGLGYVPPTLAQVDTEYASVIKHKINVPLLALSDTEYAPVIGLKIIPPVLALSDTEYAPVIGLKVIPPILALTDTEYAPVIGLKIIPPLLALSDTEYAPVIGLKIIPPLLALSDTEYAPIIGLGIIPPTLALIGTEYAPVIGLKIIPGLLVLTDTQYAPTIAVTLLVTPTTLALILAPYIPDVTATLTATVITPELLALVLSPYIACVGWTETQNLRMAVSRMGGDRMTVSRMDDEGITISRIPLERPQRRGCP